MRNENSNSILVVCGCDVEFTPVIKGFIDILSSRGIIITVVAYSHNHRFSFIFKSLIEVTFKRYRCSVFVNHQSIPPMIIASIFNTFPIFYWKLETYNRPALESTISFLEYLEHFAARNNVHLIIPSKQRLKIQNAIFNKSYIVYNSPIRPHIDNIYPLIITKQTTINLVLFGSIRNLGDLYIDKWISLVRSSSNLKLTVIGCSGANEARIEWIPRIPHRELIKRLCESGAFHYSIVGYKPVDDNTRNAAPNKAVESLSCGLPIIGHIENEYVTDIIQEFDCGIIMDFNKMEPDCLIPEELIYNNQRRNAILAAREMSLSKTLQSTPFRDLLP